ncbi:MULTISPECIES: hypothetical protein [Ferroplasma]|jgi:hypothetical protein|uniref:Uncharacterized protein n=1 Tax=Ferroplasma acidarmanus Fer1 TaxID=333146 RepID=S0AQ36_FERAC|nr:MULTISPECIES: hypothetical protein [Ferroplasma]AGO61373.1 hypothetical protein FACI_IFERC00001G1393 [Ferroplasma acidarmanus Fer1]WMT52199.1 MAG: hypothetical protein RE471_04795 [Ferroplasma sp.]
MTLNQLEKFKIKRKDDSYLSYYTLIRVRGSKPVPCFAVPSHLYKYSEHELGLYLKYHKNYWGKLGKFMNTKDNQYMEILDREMEEQKRNIWEELKKTIVSDISEIRYEILTGFDFSHLGKQKIKNTF